MITDKCLSWSCGRRPRTEVRPHIFAGIHRVYTLPNGYRLSLVNAPEIHSYPFAWEAAVITPEGWKLTYDTPLTRGVEVFMTDDEANEFIAKAIAWAEGKL